MLQELKKGLITKKSITGFYASSSGLESYHNSIGSNLATY